LYALYVFWTRHDLATDKARGSIRTPHRTRFLDPDAVVANQVEPRWRDEGGKLLSGDSATLLCIEQPYFAYSPETIFILPLQTVGHVNAKKPRQKGHSEGVEGR